MKPHIGSEASSSSGFFFPIAQIGKYTAMITPHPHPQPQFIYELFHINFTSLLSLLTKYDCIKKYYGWLKNRILNPLIPKGDQRQISSYNITTLSNAQVRRIKNIISKGMLLDECPSSQN